MRRLLPLGAVLLLACSNDLTPADSGYSAGVLGNGGFAFTCDDSVVCGKYNAANVFPDAVAVGSTFTIRYVPATGNSADGVGVTLGTVGSEYLSVTNGEYLALAPGAGSIVARDSNGHVVEFEAIQIRRPESIVVYDSKQTVDPVPTQSIDLHVAALQSFRALSRAGSTNLAGTLKYEWTSGDKEMVDAYQDNTGAVVLDAKKVGSTTLTVVGGALTTSIPVKVSQ